MKNKHIIISGIALFLITILLLGLTYAYYKTKVIGNNNEKTISSVGKKLEITYADGNGVIEAAEIEPGYTATKTFSVKNTGDDTATYSIKLDNITNTFSRTEDWTYVLKEGTAEINRGIIPTYETTLLDSIEIEAGVTKSYSLTVTYVNLTDVDQSIDMGSTLSIRVNIADAVKNSVTFIGDGNSIENYRIYGNSIQRGIPTPDNPVEIESVGDKTKNLINLDSVLSKAFTKNDDGTYSICKLSNAIRFSNFYYVDIPANTPITFSYDLIEYNGTYMAPLQMALTFDDGTVTTIGYRHINYSETATYDKPITRVRVYQENAMPDGTCTKFKNLQLELGTSATEYEPYGYKIPVTVSGKNLFNVENYSLDSSDNSLRFDVSELTIGKKYTISSTKPLKWIKISDSTTGYGSVQYDAATFYSYTFIMTRHKNIASSATQYLYVGIGNGFVKDISDLDGYELQIEEGNVATEYKPYIEPVTTNIYLDEPLRKVGDSADYIDFKEQKVVRNVATYEHKENTIATKGTESMENMIYRNYFYPTIQMKKGINSDGFCTTLDTNARLWVDLMAPSVRFGQTNNVIYIVTPNSMATNQDLYNYVTNNGQNKCIYYYQAAESMQNSQIIPVITSLNGETNITVNTALNPSYVEVK